MDKSHRILFLLAEIGINGCTTQRDLSKKLGIATGLTNAYIKRIIKKGYIKVSNLQRRSLRYILTPQGIKEKTRLTLLYMQSSYQFYREVRRNIKKKFESLIESGIKKVVFYGTGEIAELAYLSLQEVDLELVSVVDDFKVGNTFFKYKILSPDELSKIPFDKIVITSFNSSEKIAKRLESMNINGASYITLN